MATAHPTIIRVASATPPALAEGEAGVLSVDLAGNLRVSAGGASSQTINGNITAIQGSSGTWAWPVSLATTSLVGTSAFSHVGTLPVSLAATSNVSIIGTSLVSLINTSPFNLLQVGGSAYTLGQQVAANSLPVVMASNVASAVSVVGTSLVSALGTQPVSGTVTLGEGVSSIGSVTLLGTSLMSSMGTVPISGNIAVTLPSWDSSAFSHSGSTWLRQIINIGSPSDASALVTVVRHKGDYVLKTYSKENARDMAELHGLVQELIDVQVNEPTPWGHHGLWRSNRAHYHGHWR